MLDEVKKWENSDITASHSVVQKLTKDIKAHETRMETLVSTYLDGDIPKSIYLKKKDEVMRISRTLEEKMRAVEQQRNNWVEPLRE